MTANDKSEGRWSLAPEYEHRRLKLIIADGSPQYLDTVRTVLDFHETVDLLGRAANFQETIQLASLCLLPDLVLMDFEIPAAMVAIAAIVTAAPDVHEIAIVLAPQEFARMEPGVEYVLVPQNRPGGKGWKTQGRVAIKREPR